MESTCVYTKRNGERYEAVYIAKVRIRVEADGHMIIREGTGTGEADTMSPGQAHDYALKVAETDATKQALMTFGNQFGLSLYAGNGTAKRPSPNLEPPAPQAEDRDQEPAAAYASSASEPKNPETKPNGKTKQNRPPDEPARQECIDKSALTLSEPNRLREPDHLKFVVHHGCVICGKNRTQAHHLTFAQPNAMGRKVSDEFTVPLCATHHQELHHAGDEPAWWIKKAVEPTKIANALWEEDHAAADGRKT